MSRFKNDGGFRRKRETAKLEETLPNLRLEDTGAQLARGVPPHKPGPGRNFGANPYNAVPPTGDSGLNDRNSEMRKLSAWIRQKRAAEELKARRERGTEEEEK